MTLRPAESETRETAIRRLRARAVDERIPEVRDLCDLALDYADESREAYEAAEECVRIARAWARADARECRGDYERDQAKDREFE